MRSVSRKSLGCVSVILCLAVGASSCASVTNSWRFSEVLDIVKSARAQDELIARVGPPHAVERFNPGSRDDPWPVNRLDKQTWEELMILSSPGLLDKLPVGTRTLVYGFHNSLQLAGGALEIYVTGAGEILGWSYSKSLLIKGTPYMLKRPYEK
jgi:hypothetical protein